MANTINIKKLFDNQMKNGKFCRYDIMLRYLFIENYYKDGELENFQFKPHAKLIKLRNREYSAKRFIELIKSFNELGYVEEFPIVLDKKGIIRNGGHRLACCLWFEVHQIPFRVNPKKKGKKIFDNQWMTDNGFKKYIPTLKQTKKKLFEGFDQ